MNEYGVFALVLRLETLKSCCGRLQLEDIVLRVSDDQFIEILGNAIEGLKDPCEKLFADSTLIAQIDTLVQAFHDGSIDRRPAVLRAQIQSVVDGIHHTMEKRKFMILSEEEAGFYGNLNLFGESFQEQYPARAFIDGLQAGRAYAVGLPTACVFHCMRVAEYGLRKLAANSMLRVKITDRGKPCPIEYGTWNKVITAIRAKIAKIRLRPDSGKKEADLQFFSSAADHCEYMKDIWRNELSHARRSYKKEEALSVINRVKEFVTVVGAHKGSLPAEDSMRRLLAAEDPPPPPPATLSGALAALSRQSEPTA